jgi:hypothetical protein
MARLKSLLLVTLIAACCGQAAPPAAMQPHIAIAQRATELRVTINGAEFTTYRFAPTADDPKWNRPYFYPVRAADGTEVTSDQQRELLKNPKADHPHHRSIWVGHGSVNGVDHWLAGKAQQRHLRFTAVTTDGFTEELAWDSNGPDPVLLETRTVRFIAYPDGSRAIDLSSTFRVGPGGGDAVMFHCKPLNVSGVEAGLCSVRMAKALLDQPDATKHISTSAGATGEKAARSAPAEWCDYSGIIGGKPYGIAMVDSPANPGSPTAWAVRLFGLLAHVGPLNWTLHKDQAATFRHLIIVHEGDASAAAVQEKSAAWRKGQLPHP